MVSYSQHLLNLSFWFWPRNPCVGRLPSRTHNMNHFISQRERLQKHIYLKAGQAKGFHPFFCKHLISSVVPCLVLHVPAQDQSLSLLRLQLCSNPIIRSAGECTLPATAWQILYLQKQNKWWALVNLRFLHFALTILLFYLLVIVPECTLSINYKFWQDDLLFSVNDDWQVRSPLSFPVSYISYTVNRI